MKEEKEKSRLVCEKCGYATAGETAKGKTVKKASRAGTTSIKVLDDDSNIEPLPTTSAECPKCRHGTAVWWMLQTRGGDEPTTQFYRCVKCNHTWRHYA